MKNPTLADIFNKQSTETAYTPPEHWLQGRTAYGGFSASMALQVALNKLDNNLPPLKSVQISFIGPVTENVVFEVETLRKGKSATQVAVDGRIDNSLVIRAGFIFTNPRTSCIQHNFFEKPEVNLPDTYVRLSKDVSVPKFLKNFDIRFVSQSIFFTGSDTPELLAWVKLEGAIDISPEVALLLVGDCLPPAATVCLKTPAPISSMSWTVDFSQPAKHSEWYLLRSCSMVAESGYSYQAMNVWNEAGELVLTGTQTVAIFA